MASEKAKPPFFTRTERKNTKDITRMVKNVAFGSFTMKTANFTTNKTET